MTVLYPAIVGIHFLCSRATRQTHLWIHGNHNLPNVQIKQPVKADEARTGISCLPNATVISEQKMLIKLEKKLT